MLKEIHEQPKSLETCMRGRVRLSPSAPPSPVTGAAPAPGEAKPAPKKEIPREEMEPSINLGGIETVHPALSPIPGGPCRVGLPDRGQHRAHLSSPSLHPCR
jgi:hypothetical protein